LDEQQSKDESSGTMTALGHSLPINSAAGQTFVRFSPIADIQRRGWNAR